MLNVMNISAQYIIISVLGQCIVVQRLSSVGQIPMFQTFTHRLGDSNILYYLILHGKKSRDCGIALNAYQHQPNSYIKVNGMFAFLCALLFYIEL